jgi:hypothetical protein
MSSEFCKLKKIIKALKKNKQNKLDQILDFNTFVSNLNSLRSIIESKRSVRLTNVSTTTEPPTLTSIEAESGDDIYPTTIVTINFKQVSAGAGNISFVTDTGEQVTITIS